MQTFTTKIFLLLTIMVLSQLLWLNYPQKPMQLKFKNDRVPTRFAGKKESNRKGDIFQPATVHFDLCRAKCLSSSSRWCLQQPPAAWVMFVLPRHVSASARPDAHARALFCCTLCAASLCRNCTSANCTAPPGVEQQNTLSLTKNFSLTAKQMKFCSKLRYFISKYADFFSEIYRLINNAHLSPRIHLKIRTCVLNN